MLEDSKEFKSIYPHGADHHFSQPEHFERVTTLIANFFIQWTGR